MEINLNDLPSKDVYKLLTGTVVPRPIAWVSTVSLSGVNNLAPYSFANAISANPPLVVFSAGTINGEPKDTLKNVLDTGEFVYNVVSHPQAEAMNLSATELKAEDDEFEFAGVTPAASTTIKAPRVKEALVNFECKLEETYSPADGASTLVIGRVLHIHVDDSVLLDNYRIDMDVLDPVGRMAGPSYTTTRDRFDFKRLPSQRR